MLVGRTAASGQLNHAKAILAQVERLVSDRAHNRLNPSEREEFFEQVARLRLTLADAESEAEVQAAEDDVPVQSPSPVNRERLKEMAMALTASGGSASDKSQGKAPVIEETEADEERESAEPVAASADKAEEEDQKPAAAARRSDDPGQLRLPRAGSDRAPIQPAVIRSRTNGKRRVSKPSVEPKVAPAPKSPTATPSAPKLETAKVEDGPAEEAKPRKTQKLPKGWVIDEEGFVVPGPA
jgi:hypothetical protein